MYTIPEPYNTWSFEKIKVNAIKTTIGTSTYYLIQDPNNSHRMLTWGSNEAYHGDHPKDTFKEKWIYPFHPFEIEVK